MTLVIIGDSHTVALGEGLQQLSASGEASFPFRLSIRKLMSSPDVEGQFFARQGNSVTFLDPAVRRRLTEVLGRPEIEPTEGTLFAFMMGFSTTPFIRNPLWKRFSPWDYKGEDSQKSQLISASVMSSMIQTYSKYIMEFYSVLLDLGVRFVVVGAPPPRADDNAIRAGRPPQLIAKLDQEFRGELASWLEKNGIRAILPPKELGDDQGFLRSEFAHPLPKDRHHANANYGAMMVRHVVGVVANDARLKP